MGPTSLIGEIASGAIDTIGSFDSLSGALAAQATMQELQHARAQEPDGVA